SLSSNSRLSSSRSSRSGSRSTLSRTHRLFQAVYVPLWYSVANGLPIFDFMGALRDSSELATVQPPVTVVVSAALLTVVFMAGVLRRFSRD
ncbi:hypothetical protein ABZS78_40555, partial [Streptomyces decoyicus]